MTYRLRCLQALNTAPGWVTARELAAATGLSYMQTVFALNALYNLGLVARRGRKSTARWGSLVLIEHSPSADAVATLQAIFRAYAQSHDS